MFIRSKISNSLVNAKDVATFEKIIWPGSIDVVAYFDVERESYIILDTFYVVEAADSYLYELHKHLLEKGLAI